MTSKSLEEALSPARVWIEDGVEDIGHDALEDLGEAAGWEVAVGGDVCSKPSVQSTGADVREDAAPDQGLDDGLLGAGQLGEAALALETGEEQLNPPSKIQQ